MNKILVNYYCPNCETVYKAESTADVYELPLHEGMPEKYCEKCVNEIMNSGG